MNSSKVLEQIEIPHVLYPKGPIRKIRTWQNIRDAVAGNVMVVTLETCGHSATLVACAVLTPDMVVRCPFCFHDKHRGPEQVVEMDSKQER